MERPTAEQRLPDAPERATAERATAERPTAERAPAEPPVGLIAAIKGFLHKHHQKLWWLHSAYALALGAFVATFAAKGLAHVRWLLLFVLVAWFIIVAVFRLAGSGREQSLTTPRQKLHFLIMTYVLKNLYQGMLFFLLPFYWKSTTAGTTTMWFLVLLIGCTLLATLDVVFDRVLMRWRLLASLYYGMALFACLNLAVPALLGLPAAYSLALAGAGATIGFWTLHFGLRQLRRGPVALVFAFTVLLSVGALQAARHAIPPVPLTLVHAAVGPQLLPDGRLALEVTALHEDLMNQMIVVTDVLVLTDSNEQFVHVWRHFDREVLRLIPTRQPADTLIRLRSTLEAEQLPQNRAGPWTVDVETEHGQLVGRFGFVVKD